MKNKIMTIKDNVKRNLTGRCDFRKKLGGKEIIMEFCLGAIAVVLAIVFRDQLKDVIENVGGAFSEKVTALFTAVNS